jgi:RecB family exonuclease
VATELVFGRRGVAPVEITLDDGRSVRFRGSIDRVDTTADGLAVVDYKSGSAWSYKDISAQTPDAAGQRLQLPAYALAATAAFPTDGPVFSEYWFTSAKANFEARGFAVTEDVLARYRQVLAVIADSMAAGAFPARPDKPIFRPFVPCRFCDPDALGTAERWREWRRKRRAPELAALVALVEPGEDNDERA